MCKAKVYGTYTLGVLQEYQLYINLQLYHIMTLAQQQSKLDASNLSIASFTWLRAFEDRTVLTYEHEPQRG